MVSDIIHFASEGGHTSFAPSNDLEVELLRYLTAKFGGHVSRERLVSGPGIKNSMTFCAIPSAKKSRSG